jgi:peptidyl-prolyl cis-trans isomerase B (cyclophilin B)
MTRRLLLAASSLSISILLGATWAPPSLAGSRGPRAGARPGGAAKGSVVALETNHGTIQIKLFRQKAPVTTANFLRYVKKGHYNGTIFHRVMVNFMIQGGGYDKTMRKKPVGKPIRNEADNGLSNKRGTLAMARTRAPHSATAQFFINVKDNSRLDFRSRTARGWGYCVFGKVVSGMNVVDRIRKVRTTRQGPHGHVPIRPVVIKRARVVR